MTDQSHRLSEWARGYFADGSCWLGGPDWQRIAAASHYRDEAAAAAKALLEVFPWRWLRTLDLDRDLHPVVRQHVFVGGVSVLIEAGVMLSRYPRASRRLMDRLRSSRGYSDAVAELRVGLLLSDAGAQLTHEPAVPRAKGPDWRAIWDDVEASIEVKHPRMSDRARAASDLAIAFLFELQRSLLGIAPTTPASLAVELDPTLVRECTRQSWFSHERIEAAARDAASTFKARLRVPTCDERISVEGTAVFEVHPCSNGPVQFNMSLAGPPPDVHNEVAKVARVLETAASQLTAAEGARIVALHLGLDTGVANYASDIEAMLSTEGWGRSIDAVLLIDALDRDLEHCTYVIEAPTPRQSLSRFMAHLIEGNRSEARRTGRTRTNGRRR